ncbi:MAG: leucine-rich repeat domain-containing protein, partial [Anaeroplasmataceae bacterium]|nr:leucine-rich repeat domain-containing protein [Anaeroplasmataceae bacterium]
LHQATADEDGFPIADDRIRLEYNYLAELEERQISRILQKCKDKQEEFFYIPTTLRVINVTRESVLGYGAFYNLSIVEEINLPFTEALENRVTGKQYEVMERIDDFAFYNCYRLTFIEVPNLKSIATSAFANCMSLEEMILPFVGAAASNSGSLSAVFGSIFGIEPVSIDVDGTVLTAIPTLQYSSDKFNQSSNDNHRTFYLPPNLTDVRIDYETVVSYGAFYNCQTLEHITLSDSVVTIDEYAFFACMGLEEMIIPYGVSELKDYVFANCHSITRIEIPGASVNPDTHREYTGVVEIGPYAFQNCFSLEELVIPNSVNYLDEKIFTGCISLTDLTIPFAGEKARRIEDKDFTRGDEITGFFECHNGLGWLFGENIPGWTKEIIGGELKDIYDPYVFLFLQNHYSDISVDDFEETEDATAEELYREALFDQFTLDYFHLARQKSMNVYEKGSAETPATPDGAPLVGKPVTDLLTDYLDELNASEERDSFYVSKSLKYVTLTNTSMLLDETFKDCPYIEEVDMTTCDELSYIGDLAFANTTDVLSQLRMVTMDTDIRTPISTRPIKKEATRSNEQEEIFPTDLVYIGQFAFYKNCSLAHFDIPNTVREIGDYAFYCTESLGYATIPASVRQDLIGRYAFAKSGIVYLEILNGQLSEGQFMDCDKLVNLVVPELAHDAGTRVFENCDALKNIEFNHDHMTDRMFYDCDGLEEVTLTENITDIGRYVFAENDALTTVYQDNLMIGEFMFYNDRN